MERFLAQCAKYIQKRHVNELHDICLVFPNRRAGVFFTSYLQDEISTSVLGPEITTIGELIASYSNYVQGERLQLVSMLFDVFKKHTGTNESFDDFYFWGEILLTDFNDVDNYLVHAKDLFTNVSDIKELESAFDYLSPEQIKALQYFWGNVGIGEKKDFQEKHLFVWDKLYAVYSDFKMLLKSKKLAFSGMISRDVVDNLESAILRFPFKKYYFIGLNALNQCERKIFSHLKRRDKANFLWDFDQFYLKDQKHEAGKFMRENLVQFPPPDDFIIDSEVFNRSKSLKMVAVSSVFGQAQQIPDFIKETSDDFTAKFDNTAIVLADESLLFPALGAIPANAGTVNITMGYPVKNSVVYGFLTLLVSLIKNRREDKTRGEHIYYRYVTDVLKHQLLQRYENEEVTNFLNEIRHKNKINIPLTELRFASIYETLFILPKKVEDFSSYFLNVLEKIYSGLKGQAGKNKMLLELIYAVYQSIVKLKGVIELVQKGENRQINEAVYFRLFSQYLGKVNVAFEGEPLSGLQVMGILETRCLDFKNIIILGLNENKWPRTFTAPSFIPLNIRKGFGLPGIDEQDAMYSYYFYRLIQRAKNITATYSVVKEGISSGELSRYGFQLQYDSPHQVQNINLDFSFAGDRIQPITIKSSDAIVAKLLGRNTVDHPLSPSAINIYLQCSLRFYFRYALGLPEPEEVKEEIDGMIFGNIFHDTMEELYRPLIGKVVNKADFEAIQKNKIRIENEIHKQIAIHYFKEKGKIKKKVLEGKTVLIYENIKTYLRQLLRVDSSITPFTLVSLERKYQSTLDLEINGKNKQLHIGGLIDRIDRIGNITRVLDYKTGNVKSIKFNTIGELFKRDEKDPKKEILQALIYSWALKSKDPQLELQPAIYSLRNLFDSNFSPDIVWDKHNFSFDELEPELVEHLKELLSEIYSRENVFKQTTHVEKCKYCPYKKICQRF